MTLENTIISIIKIFSRDDQFFLYKTMKVLLYHDLLFHICCIHSTNRITRTRTMFMLVQIALAISHRINKWLMSSSSSFTKRTLVIEINANLYKFISGWGFCLISFQVNIFIQVRKFIFKCYSRFSFWIKWCLIVICLCCRSN